MKDKASVRVSENKEANDLKLSGGKKKSKQLLYIEVFIEKKAVRKNVWSITKR